MKASRLLPLLCVVVFALPSAALPQSATSADIEGIVTDATGGGLPGATLVVTNVATGVERRSVTGPAGRYRIPALPVGEYKFTVSLDGFATVERTGLELQIGQISTIDIEMKLATLTETVNVTQAAPLVETARTTTGTVVNRTEIDNLPINGRDFLSYSTTVAGVTAQQTSGQGSGISFNGQRGRSNNISVDGADNNGQLNGNTRLTMSQEAVREFQVATSAFAPEFGRAGGGVVNIVSRSGTNQYQGNLFFFIRDEALDAKNAFVTGEEKPPFKRKNFGGTFGGPIVKNRTFFFGSYEGMRRNESDVVTIASSAVDAINAALASRPIPNGGVTKISNGTYPIDIAYNLFSVKVDHSINPNNSLTLRYLYGKATESNAGGVSIGGLTDVSGGGGQRNTDQSLLATYTRVISPVLLSETRFQFAPRKLQQYDNDPIGPRVSISGVATFGRNINFPVLLDETRYQLMQDLSYQRGRHFFKAGFDINWVKAHTSFPVSFAGSFSFSNLANFVAGRASSFSQGFGNPVINLPDTLIGLYIQDSFKVHRDVTLVYGLRYDYDLQPQGVPRDRTNPLEAPLQDGINRDPNNVAPRVAASWNVGGSGKTVIRAGYGLFYDKIFLLVARNALLARQTISVSSATQAAAIFVQGAFPESNQLPAGFSLVKPSINIADPSITIPYTHQIDIGVERELGNDWALGASYVHVVGRNLLRSDNTNLGPPTVLTAQNAASLGVSSPSEQQIDRPYFGSTNRLDQNFTNIQMVSSTSKSEYNGLQLTVRKRMSRGFQIRANYILSKAMADSGDFTQAEQPSNPYDRAAEWGLSTEDQRHRFTMTGVWELPYRTVKDQSSVIRAILGDWVASTTIRYRSGTPENPGVGSDVNADGNSSTDRPIVNGKEVARNSFIGADSAAVDVRLSKRVRFGRNMAVQVLAEAFNVFNRVNYQGPNMTWGTALVARDTYGQFTGAGNPRQIQFGVKFEF
ncbi:MAG: TonB-dependent receptor [Acidobacteria bacterium]|nr:TonB-dependent receptor [Acidobacteriota bacterium]